MKNLIYTFILIIGLTTISCEKEKEKSKLSLLKKTWIHSYEEGYDVYRPSDYKKFPDSRFRGVFDFRNNNECSYLVLAPNDGHYMEEGTWKFDEKNNALTIRTKQSKILYNFQVLEVTENILRIENLNFIE